MSSKKIVCLLLVLCVLLFPGCANTEELDALIQVPVAAEDSYTPNSYSEYAAALEAANAVLGERSPEQEAVDAATERLQQSLDGLLLRADKTELEVILAEARGIDRSIYLPISVEGLDAAVQSADTVIADLNALDVDVAAMVSKIERAMESLVLKPDKSELAKLYDASSEIDTSLYLTSSLVRFYSVMDETKVVLDDENATATDVNEALKQLEESKAQLEKKPDKTVLEELLNTAGGYAEEKYTTETFSSLESAISQGKKIVDDENATQSDVDAAVAFISKSIENLELRPDNTKLAKLVETARGYKEEKYTTVSYNNLASVIPNAEKVLNNQNATQSAIDNAAAELQDAMDALKKCTKCVWRIEVDLDMVSNNHVGNDWSYGIFYNGNDVWGSFEVTKAAGSTISIKGKAVENDKIPDSGSGTLSLKLTDGNEKSITFSVRENRGRYSGNRAVWELTASCTLIERV